MKRLSLFACVALLGLGTTAALQTRSRTTPSDAAPSVVDQALRGVAPQLLVGRHEAERYCLEEGAFYGNIFSDPNKPLDWNACRGKDAAAGETGDLKLRVCTEPDPNDPAHTKCGFNRRRLQPLPGFGHGIEGLQLLRLR